MKRWRNLIAPLGAVLGFSMALTGLRADPINVAPMGVASQSTTGWNMPATLALDGNYNNITHTDGTEVAPDVAWWEVDTGETYPLERIAIYNRISCCWERLCNIKVYVLDAARAVQWESDLLNPNNALGFATGNVGGFDIDLIALEGAAVEGQIVRVERTHDEESLCDGYYVSLAEVEVFVDSSNIPVDIVAQPVGGRAYIGGCFVFSVGLFNAESAASITYRWQKDGGDIPGATSSRLIIAGVQEDDAGIYTVVVDADGDILTSDPAVLDVVGLNLALYGTATQSSLGYGGVPERAIDGNTSGIWGDGSITHTADNDPTPWWQVELFGDTTVDTVILWNRIDDCCIRRLTDFRFTALDPGGEVVYTEDLFTDLNYPNPMVEIDVGGEVCRTIRIERLGPDIDGLTYLSLAEVEIFGDGPVPPPDPRPNLARVCGSLATHSSQLGGYHAGLAIDGNYNNFTHTFNTDDNATWEVDLQAEYDIAQIVLYNRAGYGSRLRDITVSILDADGDPLWDSALLNPENELGAFPLGPPSLTVNVVLEAGAPVTGQIVRVHRTADPDLSGGGDGTNLDEGTVLSLAEVEIYEMPSDCPAEGDTHCEELIVEGPDDSYPGYYTVTAFADDDSGDPIFYTFTVEDPEGGTRRIGPQEQNTLQLYLTAGAWSFSVTVDDDSLCMDAADDITCSAQKEVLDVENLAAGGIASQSSDYTAATPASLAIDSILTNYTHTAAGNNGLGPAIWELDLLEAKAIGKIVLYNRTDCCGSRLRDIVVSIHDVPLSADVQLDPGITDIGFAAFPLWEEALYESDLLNPENAENPTEDLLLGPISLEVKLGGEGVTGQYVRVTRIPDADLSGTEGQGNTAEPDVISLAEVMVFPATGEPDEPRLVRGDPDSSGVINITDGIRILSYLFTGGAALECADAGDTDDDGALTITDAIKVFGYLFLGQGEPAAPAPSNATYVAGDCGVDTGTTLGCDIAAVTCGGTGPQ